MSRVQATADNTNTVFRILVDSDQEVALTNTGHSGGWSYDLVSMHGVVSGLSAGEHTAVVQYKVQKGSVHFPSDSNGENHMRLTALRTPTRQLITTSHSGVKGIGSSTTWAELPSGLALSTTFTTTGDESVILFADMSRVQATADNTNTVFR